MPDATIVNRAGDAVGVTSNRMDVNAAVTPAVGLTYTDASIANASGASETVAALSTTRKKLSISNPSATSWWINASGGVAAANTAGSFELPPQAMWNPDPPPLNIVKGIGTLNADLTVVVA